MQGGWEVCTEGAVIHKAAVRRCGYKRGTEGTQGVHIRQLLMHALVVW